MKSETQTLAEQDDERYARNHEVWDALKDFKAKGWKQLLRQAALLGLISYIQYGSSGPEDLAERIKTIIE